MKGIKKSTAWRLGLTCILLGMLVCIYVLIIQTPELDHAYLIQRGNEEVMSHALLPDESWEQSFFAYKPFDHVVLNRLDQADEGILEIEIIQQDAQLFSDELIFSPGVQERELAVQGEAGTYVVRLTNSGKTTVEIPLYMNNVFQKEENFWSLEPTLQFEVYRTTDSAKWCYLAAALILAVLACVVLWIWGKKWTPRKAAGYIMTVSLAYLFLFPAWNINDFGKHFATAYAYTNTILGVNADDPEDLLIREDDAVFFYEVFNDRNQTFYRPTIRSYDDAVGYLFQHTENNHMISYGDYNGVHREYGAWNYLPQILGILIARLLSLNLVTAVFLARICSALFYVGIICLAMRKLPNGMLIPITILSCVPVGAMNMTAICYDAPCFAAALYLFASIFALREKYSTREAVCLAVCSLAISLVKRGAYIPLLASLLLLYRKKDKQGFLLILCCAMMAGIGLVINYGGVLFGGESNIYLNNAGRGTFDAKWALKHPWDYLVMMIRAYLRQPDKIYSVIGRHLSWHGEALPEYVCGLFYLLMVLSAIIPGQRDQPVRPLVWKERIWIWLPVLIMAAMLPATMLSYTKLEWDTIENIQGRYYLPLLVPLLMLCYYNLRGKVTFRMKDSSLFLGGAAFLHVLSVYYIWLSFIRGVSL